MSQVVDSRVLEMKFDNRDFERNIKTSMNSLDELKESLKLEPQSAALNKSIESNLSVLDRLKNKLKLTDGAQGLEKIGAAAKNVDMSALSSSVEAVKVKFSALQVIGVTALSNITNSAINAARALKNNVSDAIMGGGKRRALNIEQAKFQFKGLGMDVTKAMASANAAVDGTAYGLDSAAKAAAQFGASGMQAGDEMTKALRGIAGVAAMTSSEYDDVARIFTTVSGNGRVMGEQLLQISSRGLNAAAALGKYLGKSEAEVRDMVSKGQIDFKTFYTAMDEAFGEHAKEANKTFTGAMSNVRAALSRIGADVQTPYLENMRQIFVALIPVLNKVRSALKPLTNQLAYFMNNIRRFAVNILENLDLSFLDHVVRGVMNSIDGLLLLLRPLRDALMDFMPDDVQGKILNLAKGFQELTFNFKRNLQWSEGGKKATEDLKNTFKGLFAVVDMVGRAFAAVLRALSPLLGVFAKVGSVILSITGNIGKFLVKLDEAVKKTDFFNAAMKGASNFVEGISNVIKSALSVFDLIGKRMGQVGNSAQQMGDGVVGAIGTITNALSSSNILGVLQSIWDCVTGIVGGIAKMAGDISTSIVNTLNDANFDGFIDLMNGLSIAVLANGLGNVFNNFAKKINEIKGFTGNIINIFKSVKSCLVEYQKQIQAGTIMRIAAAVGILAAAIMTISLIDSKKLAASLGAITFLFANLMASMAIFDKLAFNVKGVAKTCAAMISISTAVLILSAALKKLGSLNMKELTTGLIGVIGLTATMVGAAKILGSGEKAIIKGAASMVIFAAAIKVLASACKNLAVLDLEGLTKGLVGIGILLVEIGAFLKFSGKAENLISTSVAIIAISAGLKILVSAMTDISAIPFTSMVKSLLGIAGALGIIAVAVKFMPGNIIATGAGLVIVAAALNILAKALSSMAIMSWDEIGRGLVVLGGALLILSGGLYAMKNSVAGSASLLIASAALAILAPVLKSLGSLSWEQIAKGLASIAGAFIVLGVAGAVLGPLVPAILGLAGAFALIGVAVLAAGAGLMAAGIGLTAAAAGFAALAAAGVAGATAVVSALTVIITGIASLIPAVAKKIGEGIVEFCKAIASGADAIAAALKAVILNSIETLTECVPAITEGLLELLTSALESLAKHIPRMVDALCEIIIGVLDGLARNIPKLIGKAVEVIMSVFSGVVDALKEVDPEILIKGIAGIGIMSALMIALAAVAALVPAAMVGVLGIGAVIAEMAIVLAAIGALSKIPGLTWLIDGGADLLGHIGNAIGRFIGGIVGGAMSGITSNFPKIGSDLSGFMENAKPFIEGASKINPNVSTGIKALTEAVLLLTASDLLQSLTSWITGGSSLTKFGQDLAAFAPYFRQFYESVQGIDGSVVEASANAAKSLAEFAHNIPNENGLLAGIVGDNSLAQFAEELAAFGPSFKQYATDVSGIDPNVVIATSNAAKVIAEFANMVPNSRGLAEFFAGGNDIGVFGESLKTFGGHFKEYSTLMQEVDTEAILSTTAIAKSLVEFANSLSSEEGAGSDKSGLDTFGKNLKDFGDKFKKYAESVSEIETDKLAGAINEMNKVIAMAKNMAGIDANAITNFGTALTNLGNTGVDGFINAFTGASARVSAAATQMINSFIQSATSAGSRIRSTFISLMQIALTSIQSKVPAVVKAGTDMMKKFANAIKTGATDVAKEFQSVGAKAVEAIRSKYDSFYSAGAYLVSGFASGISANAYKAAAKARAMAAAADKAARAELQVNSPAKKGIFLGKFYVLGVVKGIADNISKATQSTKKMATSIVDTSINALSRVANLVDRAIGDNSMNIVPVVDTPGPSRITPVFTIDDPVTKALNIEASMAKAYEVSASMNQRHNSASSGNDSNAQSNTTTYEFNQYNYSPKALDRTTIYRQTKNQISQLKKG